MVAAKNITVYAPRAPIVDCRGVAISYSEWQFYIFFNRRKTQRVQNFCRLTGIPFNTVKLQKKIYCIRIPADKLDDALENAKKMRLQLQRIEVRQTLPLPPHIQFKLGSVLFRNGICGLEKKYDLQLRGTPGFYQIMLGPAGNADASNMKIFLPLNPGKPLKLKQSLLELQCGIIPQAEDEYEKI